MAQGIIVNSHNIGNLNHSHMTKIQTSISRRGQLEWVIENLPVNVLLVAIHCVDTRYLWKSWVWSRYDQYGGCEDDDGDDDDAKPADAPITGLVGPFPPPLLYWNSTQALKRTKWWRSFESLSLLIIKVVPSKNLGGVSWLSMLHNVHSLELNLKS